ncbi:MAG: ATP-binding protein [Methylovulum sp.]|nr:ATP-binding protein [Methylovulum sp.]
MKIPEKFKRILDTNQALNAVILDIVTSFQPVFEDNKLFFFEEYTDHGIKHIQSVLASAEFIIADDAFENMNAKDVAILILSVILHDIGMHTEYATFVALLDGHYDHCKTCLDTKTWRELWVDYLSEAKRFSSQQKRNIFGNEFQAYNEPDMTNKDKLTGYDKKLIGEFIRRYHARLAHEIAFNGLIGKNQETIKFGNEKLTSLYRGMAGIVARSHGMNLRDTFLYLESIGGQQGWRYPDDVNIVFLMVVLRIADYIQIDASRVNPFLLKLKTFNSPISLNEHKAHLAIEFISFKHDDPERFYVKCDPDNSGMLVKLQNLFTDIQKELDVSWAVLGEVYGFRDFPKIKFRRITSNFEEANYLTQLPFVPQKISFQVNNELSKLLVAPLYGNRATYGVRELVQNAVDACRERQHLETRAKNAAYELKVTVSIEQINEQESIFKIADNGKGMDIDEIVHYFLNIGVSFRKSLAWRKQFVDDQGHSQVNRNGRFGIGVLAAFLIGEEITVKTRKYNDQTAYSFATTIDSGFIEIQREQNSVFAIGTAICLNLSNEKREELLKDGKRWTDWYIGNSPKVEYFLDKKNIEPSFKVDRNKLNIFETENFKNIHWSFNLNNPKNGRFSSAIVVNDIVISKSSEYRDKIHEFNFFMKKGRVINARPSSFLFEDPEGLFPLKLDRNEIDCDKLPFEEGLYLEVAKSFIAYILNLEVSIKEYIPIIKLDNFSNSVNMLFSKNGFTFNIDFFCKKLESSSFSLIRLLTERQVITSEFLNYEDCLFYLGFSTSINYVSNMEHLVAPRGQALILLRSDSYQNLFNIDMKRITKRAIREHHVLFKNDDFVLYSIYSFNKNAAFLIEENMNFINSLDKDIGSIQEVPYSILKPNGKYLESGEILHDLLTKYIGDEVIIPYDMEERKRKYPKAFAELAIYMDKLQYDQ